MHPEQRPFELPDVLVELRGDEVQDLVGYLQAVAKGLHLEDGDAGLQVGRLDVNHQAGPEPAAQSLLDPAELLGRTVAGDDDLTLVLVEMVEGVEELGL